MKKTEKCEISTQNDIYLIGSQTGQCDICGETTKIYLLKFGFTLCRKCIDVSTSILESLTTKEQLEKQIKNLKPHQTTPRKSKSILLKRIKK